MVQIGKYSTELYIIDFKIYNYSNVYSLCISGITFVLISFYKLKIDFINYTDLQISLCFNYLGCGIHNVILVINTKK